MPQPISPDHGLQPMDEYNRILVSHVHPPDWRPPKPADRYHLVVIGAGTAGLVTAAGAAGLGAKVALVERHLMGGDCLNTGCVPSKCLIHSARAYAQGRAYGETGTDLPEGAREHFEQAMQRMRKIRSEISRHDAAERFQGLGVDVFLGEASFQGSDTIAVGGEILRFKRAVICTGARAITPPITGLLESGGLTNETIFNLTELPRRLLVIGGGPIGCEMAQTFRRFGSEVHLVDIAGQLLPREDPEAAAILEEVFKREGIQLYLHSTVGSVHSNGQVKEVAVRHGESEQAIAVDEILVAAGRAPNVEGMNLEAVGIRYDTRQGVWVNDYLQTSHPRTYAAGDICMAYKFTHAADAAARIVIQNALFKKRARASGLIIPWCTYTQPEIAHVGIDIREAQHNGVEIDTYCKPMREVDRALAEGETEGFVKIHTAKGKGRILGATIVAEHAGEMISEITLAMKCGAGLGALSSVIHPYPTRADAMRQLGDAYNRTRLTPWVKNLMRLWFRMT